MGYLDPKIESKRFRRVIERKTKFCKKVFLTSNDNVIKSISFPSFLFLHKIHVEKGVVYTWKQFKGAGYSQAQIVHLCKPINANGTEATETLI